MRDLPAAPHATSRLVGALLLAVLAARILAMALYPVTDTTEARYAEISRLMAATGDWLMPQVETGVPFWGKPPLFAWLSAAALKLTGSSEFSIRLPHFVLALATLWLVTVAAARESVASARLTPALILASTPLFYLASGAVMTESGLLFSTTLAMTGFWLGTQHGHRGWGLAFFAGLGLGMLAKGPVAPVMILLSIGMWLLASRRWAVLKRLPWAMGVPLALLVFVPWYVAAERHSPGFLSYFIIGEHLLRFIQPGWQGDLYGNAHNEPLGMIWLLWFKATAVWGLVFAIATIRLARKRSKGPRWLRNDWRRYLLCWLVAPLLFFTFSTNILWTYVITGLPALALLLCPVNGESEAGDDGRSLRLLSLGVSPVLLTVIALSIPVAHLAVLYLAGPLKLEFLSEKALVTAYEQRKGPEESLYYLDYMPVSAAFYSQGRAQVMTLGGQDRLPREFWLAVHKTRGNRAPNRCQLAVQPQTGLFDLYRCHG